VKDAVPFSDLEASRVIDVWVIDLEASPVPTPGLDGLLSPVERDRARRYIFPTDAYRFRLCRAMLRAGLGWLLRKSPQAIEFKTGDHGKPHLSESSDVRFNVSHSSRLALIAFSRVGDVGVDVEEVREDIEALEIASANFSETEAARISAATTVEDRARLFVRIWTRKEAIMKAAGIGIQDGLGTFDVSSEPPGLVCLDWTPAKVASTRWLVQELDLPRGYAGAVAAPVGPWTVRQWMIQCQDVLLQLAGR